MIAQTRAELLKIRSTRTTIGLILGMIALILLFTLLTGLLSHPSGLASKEDQRSFLSLASLAGVFSALAGALLVTSEYRYGTIRPTVLFNPARSRVLSAKVIAGALAGIAFGVIGEAIGWAIGYAILEGRGITVALNSSDIVLLRLGGLAGVALWGAIGPGLGAIIHNQVGAVITLLAWGPVLTTSSYSASRLPLGGSCPHVRLTRRWASKPITYYRPAPAPSSRSPWPPHSPPSASP